MHKKQKLLIQEVENTIYAQTPTLTTQAHTDIEMDKPGESKTSTKHNSLSLFLSFIFSFLFKPSSNQS